MTPDNLDTKLDDAMIEIAGRPVDRDWIAYLRNIPTLPRHVYIAQWTDDTPCTMPGTPVIKDMTP